MLTLVFSGDSFRLISLGGPRSWAYVFQIGGMAALLSFLRSPDSRARAQLCGTLLGIGAVMHLFFAFTNALIVGLGGAAALWLGRGRQWHAVLILAASFAIVAAPYTYVKRGSIPDAVMQMPTVSVPEGQPSTSSAVETIGDRRLTSQRLLSLQWGEYGSLVPLLAAPMLWSVRRRPREEVALYCIVFAIPCLAMLVPPVYRTVIRIVADSRIERVIPLSAIVAAVLVYAAAVWAAGAGASRTSRMVGIAALVVCSLLLIPSTRAAWNWYTLVYPTTTAERTREHSYIAVGSLLRLGTERWPAVLATSRPVAARLASATNRPIAFYHEGRRRWATREGNAMDADQAPLPFEFVVSAGHPFPSYASCSWELFSSDVVQLCATDYGIGSWSYPGRR